MRIASKTLSGGLLAAALNAGWVGGVVLIAMALLVIAVFCWIVADADRAKRAALVLRAWRQTSRRNEATRKAKGSSTSAQ